MTSILAWEEMHPDESLPIASPEILRLIPPFHAGNDEGSLVILPKTIFKKIMHHVKGDCTVERIGMLIGRPFTRPSSGQLLICVDAALPIEDKSATNTSVSIQKDGWQSAWSDLNLASEERIIGWYHSHPNHGVFLSAVDRKTQSLWFVQEWKLAIVLDPIRGEYQAFTGADGIAAPIVLI